MKNKINKKWKYRNGEIPFNVTEITTQTKLVIVSIDNDGYTLIHDSKGKLTGTDGAFVGAVVEDSYDLIEVGKYDHIEIGDRVLVNNGNSDILHRQHFAGVSENGNPMAFTGGSTEWTSNNKKVEWRVCIKAPKSGDE